MPLDSLMTSLSKSDTLQQWLSGDEEMTPEELEALTVSRIYKNGLPRNSIIEDIVPYVLISSGNNRSWSKIGTSCFEHSGTLLVEFENLKGEGDEKVLSAEQDELCDKIIQDIVDMDDKPGCLSIEEVERTESSEVYDEVYEKQIIQTKYTISWR